MSNGRKGTESDTIESRLVRVTTSKRFVGFHILVSSFQKGYVFTKIYGNTCKLKTRFFLVIKANVWGSAFCVNDLQVCRCLLLKQSRN